MDRIRVIIKTRVAKLLLAQMRPDILHAVITARRETRKQQANFYDAALNNVGKILKNEIKNKRFQDATRTVELVESIGHRKLTLDARHESEWIYNQGTDLLVIAGELLSRLKRAFKRNPDNIEVKAIGRGLKVVK